MRRLTIMSFVLVMSLVLSVVPSQVSASPKPADDTPVIAAQDQTREADCKSWVDSPENEQPCELGSVIIARDTTYAEVKKKDIKEWAVRAKDEKQNKIIEQELVGKVRKRVHGDTVTAAACVFTPNKSKSGSYLTIPGNPNSARVEYTFRYTLQGNCAVTDAVDYGRIIAGVLTWSQSCVFGLNNCVPRNVVMNQNWAGPFGLPNTAVGREYRHISVSPCGTCGRPYGINTFD